MAITQLRALRWAHLAAVRAALDQGHSALEAARAAGIGSTLWRQLRSPEGRRTLATVLAANDPQGTPVDLAAIDAKLAARRGRPRADERREDGLDQPRHLRWANLHAARERLLAGRPQDEARRAAGMTRRLWRVAWRQPQVVTATLHLVDPQGTPVDWHGAVAACRGRRGRPTKVEPGASGVE